MPHLGVPDEGMGWPTVAGACRTATAREAPEPATDEDGADEEVCRRPDTSLCMRQCMRLDSHALGSAHAPPYFTLFHPPTVCPPAVTPVQETVVVGNSQADGAEAVQSVNSRQVRPLPPGLTCPAPPSLAPRSAA